MGGGLLLNVDEKNNSVPGAFANAFDADSLDLTYHACTNIGGANNKRLQETGYFWNSSYQDADSVVDSQINYFLPNGYHIYGLYTYQAGQAAGAQPTPTGDRLNYVVRPVNAVIELYVDPEQDTTLELVDCEVDVGHNADDLLVGSSNAVAQGEKSETSGLANGDFKVVLSDWVWDSAAGDLFGSPANANFLVFNGNLTNLGVGALGADHNPEGSGNIFWLQDFDRVHGDD
ncbi:MAG: hypothetical protein ACREXY_06730 [Gammaproteobacteria bacterium]